MKGIRAALREAAFAAVGITVLYFLFRLFPVTGDDFFREDVGRRLHSLSDLAARVSQSYLTTNSRVFGNVLAYAAGSRPVLRALAEAVITCCTAVFAARAAGVRTLGGRLLLFTGLFALPLPMFRQIYPWAAGFFNYVPPVACMLAACALCRPLFEEPSVLPPKDVSSGTHGSGNAGGTDPRRAAFERYARSAALAALGFAGQLFMEHNTLCMLGAAAVFLLLYRRKTRTWSVPLLWFFLGAAGGAALLFLSPCYRIVGEETSIYSVAGGSGAGFWDMIRENTEEILKDLAADSPVIHTALTLLPAACLLRRAASSARTPEARPVRRILPELLLCAVLLSGWCFFLLRGREPEPDTPFALLVSVTLVWAAAVFCAAVRGTDGNRRLRALTALTCAAAVSAPLAAVSPIGPRCLYAGYVFLLIAAAQFLSALTEGFPARAERTPVRRRSVCTVCGAFCAVLAAAAVIGTAVRYLPVSRNARTQEALLRAAMEERLPEVILPACPSPELLWEPDGPKIVYAWYYEVPGDLTVRFEKGASAP